MSTENAPTAARSATDCYRLKMEHRGWFRWDAIDEGRWYWWWDEDPDGVPVPVNVMYSPTTEKCFASTGQLGWNRAQDVDSMGGWWMKLVEPSVADHPDW
jgi:hypothetical protein